MGSERRQFYRILVELQWEWKVLSEQEKQLEIQRLETTDAEPVDPYIRWKRLALQFDETYQEMLEAITPERQLLGILYDQNKLIAELNIQLIPGSLAAKSQEMVSLSAVGIGAWCRTSSPEGLPVKGTILLPTYEVISFVGELVQCQPESSSLTAEQGEAGSGLGFRIGIAFEVIRPQDLEQLQRYLILAEAKQRRTKLAKQ